MKTGVYVLTKGRKVIYVGQTKQWPIRLNGHKQIDFDGARLFECDPDSLLQYENRFMEIFKPQYNRTGKNARIHCLIPDGWIHLNKSQIERCFNDLKFRTSFLNQTKADLKYSQRSGTTDMFYTILKKYCKAFNVSYKWAKDNKRIKMNAITTKKP